jgi:hypothetical protein
LYAAPANALLPVHINVALELINHIINHHISQTISCVVLSHILSRLSFIHSIGVSLIILSISELSFLSPFEYFRSSFIHKKLSGFTHSGGFFHISTNFLAASILQAFIFFDS